MASMAGRRRAATRASKPHIQYIKEGSILKPKPPGVTDDNWPCFVLTDATIYRSDGKTIANPLHCQLEGAMVIRGKLVIDEEDKDAVSKLVNRSTRTAYIEISGSDRYSIGYKPAVFWVSGAAGWFEINPSAEYEAMYREVQEAVELYYSVIMVYEEHRDLCLERRKKKRGSPLPPTLDDILFQYAMTRGDGIVRDEAEATCHKWAQFLIAHFSKELDIACDDTLFAQWMRESHPELTQRIKDASAGLIPPAPIPPASEPVDVRPDPRQQRGRSAGSSVMSSARNSEDVEMSDVSAVTTHKPVPVPKPKLISNTPVPLPSYSQYAIRQAPPSHAPATQESPAQVESKPSPAAESFSVIDRLVEVFKEEVEEKKIDVTKAAETRFVQAIWHRCKTREYAIPREIMKYYAKDLLPALPSEWRQSPFYQWLKQRASEPRVLPEGQTVEDWTAQLVRRIKKPKQQTISNPPAAEPRPRARKSPQDLDEEEEEPPRQGKRPPVMGARKSGKGAVLRPTTSKKRPASMMDDDEDDASVDVNRPGRKLSKRNRGIVDDSSDSDDSDDDDNGDVFSTSTGVPKDAVRVVVHSERLPTLSPSGPNGTWVCDQEGCGHVVREAEDQVGQGLIKSHFEWHQAQAEKINLAMAESRGQMPINHLLDKLQEIGKKTLLKKRGSLPNGEPLVPPIKRKLWI